MSNEQTENIFFDSDMYTTLEIFAFQNTLNEPIEIINDTNINMVFNDAIELEIDNMKAIITYNKIFIDELFKDIHNLQTNILH